MAPQNVLVQRGDGILVEQATVSLKDDWCFPSARRSSGYAVAVEKPVPKVELLDSWEGNIVWTEGKQHLPRRYKHRDFRVQGARGPKSLLLLPGHRRAHG